MDRQTPYGEGQIKSESYSKPKKVGDRYEVTKTVVVEIKQRDFDNGKAKLQNMIRSMENADYTKQLADCKSKLADMNAA